MLSSSSSSTAAAVTVAVALPCVSCPSSTVAQPSQPCRLLPILDKIAEAKINAIAFQDINHHRMAYCCVTLILGNNEDYAMNLGIHAGTIFMHSLRMFRAPTKITLDEQHRFLIATGYQLRWPLKRPDERAKDFATVDLLIDELRHLVKLYTERHVPATLDSARCSIVTHHIWDCRYCVDLVLSRPVDTCATRVHDIEQCVDCRYLALVERIKESKLDQVSIRELPRCTEVDTDGRVLFVSIGVSFAIKLVVQYDGDKEHYHHIWFSQPAPVPDAKAAVVEKELKFLLECSSHTPIRGTSGDARRSWLDPSTKRFPTIDKAIAELRRLGELYQRLYAPVATPAAPPRASGGDSSGASVAVVIK